MLIKPLSTSQPVCLLIYSTRETSTVSCITHFKSHSFYLLKPQPIIVSVGLVVSRDKASCWKTHTCVHSCSGAAWSQRWRHHFGSVVLTLLNKARLISITPASSAWGCVCESDLHTRCLTPSLSQRVAKRDTPPPPQPHKPPPSLSNGWWASRGLWGVLTFNWAPISTVVK